MKFELFATLYNEALEYDDVDLYIAERGWQDWMDPFKENEIGPILMHIHELAKHSIKEMRETRKISRVAFSKMYSIPIRTLEDWDNGNRKITDYNKMLIAYTFLVGELIDQCSH